MSLTERLKSLTDSGDEEKSQEEEELDSNLESIRQEVQGSPNEENVQNQPEDGAPDEDALIEEIKQVESALEDVEEQEHQLEEEADVDTDMPDLSGSSDSEQNDNELADLNPPEENGEAEKNSGIPEPSNGQGPSVGLPDPEELDLPEPSRESDDSGEKSLSEMVNETQPIPDEELNDSSEDQPTEYPVQDIGDNEQDNQLEEASRTEKPQDTRIELEPSHVEQAIKRSDTIQQIQSQLNDFEQNFVSEESEELSNISRLEKRVEQLELEESEHATHQDLEELRQDLIQRIEANESPESLDNRLTELENRISAHAEWLENDSSQERISQVEDSLNELGDHLDKEISEVASQLEQVQERVEQLENSQERQIELEDRINQLSNRIDTIEDSVGGDVSNDVEELWEAMDEEMSKMEKQIHQNREEKEELMQRVVELSELVKRSLQ